MPIRDDYETRVEFVVRELLGSRLTPVGVAYLSWLIVDLLASLDAIAAHLDADADGK
jgi:hypothetical protein